MDLSKVEKYEDFSFAQWIAFGNKAGGIENIKEVLQGEKEIVLKDVFKKMFDKNGRRIPEGLRAKVCDPRSDFYRKYPKLTEDADFEERIVRLHDSLNIDTGITAKHFRGRSRWLNNLIRGNPCIANITNSICLPIIFPKSIHVGWGTEAQMYLEGVCKSYAKEFGDRVFKNFLNGKLEQETGIIMEDRNLYQKICKLFEASCKGPVVGLYFPNALQGFSINASREQMATLPKGFILSGLDTLIAIIMYPDILAADTNNLALNLSSLFYQYENEYSFFFEAGETEAVFAKAEYLDHAYSRFSNGLLFISPEITA